jgi:hypothetical protein
MKSRQSGRLLTERWVPSAPMSTLPMEPIDAQAEKAAQAAQRPEPFPYMRI